MQDDHDNYADLCCSTCCVPCSLLCRFVFFPISDLKLLRMLANEGAAVLCSLQSLT
ncbi:hypothetical protein RchiOBHm_Chr4g0405521 [Rosa chinensis]|uniref:Uncharacterized protein n=1 Tax=Rosa chinensis TaxID=74649 RepID=A0A2P6QU39_ROSCH|nr:hypothetical protein RchiOBHm_Chr4g0405521 [Rosa chinensis]